MKTYKNFSNMMMRISFFAALTSFHLYAVDSDEDSLYAVDSDDDAKEKNESKWPSLTISIFNNGEEALCISPSGVAVLSFYTFPPHFRHFDDQWPLPPDAVEEAKVAISHFSNDPSLESNTHPLEEELHYGCMQGDEERVMTALNSVSNVNEKYKLISTPDKSGHNAFHWAALSGADGILYELIGIAEQQKDGIKHLLSSKTFSGQTPLQLAELIKDKPKDTTPVIEMLKMLELNLKDINE